MPNHYEQEILAALKPYAHAEQAVFRKKYMSTELDVLGLTVPQQRLVAKQHFSFSDLRDEERIKIWDEVWKATHCFEVRSVLLIWYEARRKQLTLKDWSVLRHWVEQVDNWAHSDGLSDLYAHLHETYPDKIFPVYQRWITSKEPWKRRAALVGLFYYASKRKQYPSFQNTIEQVAKALKDTHVFVQKGVGWTLRECYNIYPQETYKQLLLWAKELSPIAWYAATEKLSANEKRTLKAARLKK